MLFLFVALSPIGTTGTSGSVQPFLGALLLVTLQEGVFPWGQVPSVPPTVVEFVLVFPCCESLAFAPLCSRLLPFASLCSAPLRPTTHCWISASHPCSLGPSWPSRFPAVWCVRSQPSSQAFFHTVVTLMTSSRLLPCALRGS